MKDILTRLLIASLATSTICSCASQNKINTANKTVTANKASKNIGNENIDNEYMILSDAQLATIRRGNTFALNLFRTQIGQESKVISPVSASLLMGMLANGASEGTRDEILKTLLDDKAASMEDLNEAYKALVKFAVTHDKQVSLDIANFIAVNKQIGIKQSYTNTMKDIFEAETENLDFASKSSVAHINDWCSRKTGGMIPKILDSLSPSDMAVLVDAIFFNATWEKKFDKRNTQEEAFKGYTRDIKRVHMMHQNEKFMYTENSKFSAIELPYGNGDFTMTAILPNNGVSTKEIMENFTSDDLAKMMSSTTVCNVDLKMPRFTTTTDIKLNKPIADLGAPSMFNPSKANFNNISDNGFHVSSMIQKAKIEVSEEGTKAAAVTAAIMMMSALNPEEPRHVEFHADRPFIYIITERTSGAIFFIGQFTGSDI